MSFQPITSQPVRNRLTWGIATLRMQMQLEIRAIHESFVISCDTETSVLDLKKKIHQKMQVSPSAQRLILRRNFQGLHDNEQFLTNAGVSDGDVLIMFLENRTSTRNISICVRLHHSSKIDDSEMLLDIHADEMILDIDAKKSVQDLKVTLAPEVGIHSLHQILIYGGKALTDDTMSLVACGMETGSTIFLVCNLVCTEVLIHVDFRSRRDFRAISGVEVKTYTTVAELRRHLASRYRLSIRGFRLWLDNSELLDGHRIALYGLTSNSIIYLREIGTLIHEYQPGCFENIVSSCDFVGNSIRK
jgi:hypothetical protein